MAGPDKRIDALRATFARDVMTAGGSGYDSAWVRGFWDAMRPPASGSGSYVNYT